MCIFIAIVRININAIKFEDITVTFQPNKPNNPVIIITENTQLLIGTKTQINFLNTNHKVAMINKKTPSPNTIISLFINVFLNGNIINILNIKSSISLTIAFIVSTFFSASFNFIGLKKFVFQEQLN